MESTLVYTLLCSDKLSFDDFFICVKGLHSHMSQKFEAKPDQNCVYVHLLYNANMANVRAKLGALASFISVSKMNPHLKGDEFLKLEQLRQRFNFGGPIPEEPKKRGGYSKRVFKSRQKPYSYEKKSYSSAQAAEMYIPDQDSKLHLEDSSDNEQ